MRLPCGHYGDEWRGGERLPSECTDPECAGFSPDPWLMADIDGNERQHRKQETRSYRQSKARRRVA